MLSSLPLRSTGSLSTMLTLAPSKTAKRRKFSMNYLLRSVEMTTEEEDGTSKTKINSVRPPIHPTDITNRKTMNPEVWKTSKSLDRLDIRLYRSLCRVEEARSHPNCRRNSSPTIPSHRRERLGPGWRFKYQWMRGTRKRLPIVATVSFVNPKSMTITLHLKFKRYEIR